jgi:phenylalanine-4-hydroxylase
VTHASPPVASTEAQRAPRPPWTSRHDLAKLPYRFEDRIVWKALHARQTRVLERWGCSDYMKGMWVLGIHSEEFPDLTHLNARLQAATCWELLVQHEELDPLKYFSHLARRRFPVRSTVAGSGCAPGRSTGTDLFHHLFGHVPMLAQPVFADYLQMLGQAACAAGAAALPLYLQHYERTADRGLIRTPRGLRMYGASLVCEATGELAGPANGFFVHGGGHVRLEDCCTIDSFEQLITTLPRTAPATDSPIGTAATGTRRLRRSLR